MFAQHVLNISFWLGGSQGGFHFNFKGIGHLHVPV
jgi:hypothetical protein